MLSPAKEQASCLPASHPQSQFVQVLDFQVFLQAGLFCLVSGGGEMQFMTNLQGFGEILVVRRTLFW